MTEFPEERLAFLNAVAHSAACYNHAAPASGYFATMLQALADERAALAKELADLWQLAAFDPPVTPANLDDLDQRCASGDHAVAEFIEGEEQRIAEMVEDMPQGALADDLTARLLASATKAREDTIAVLLTLRASADDGGPRDRGLIFGRKDAEMGVPPHPPARALRIYYATNRNPIRRADRLVGYGAERSDEVHLGQCDVVVPHTHRIGSTGSPWWHRILRGDDRLRVAGLQDLAADAYWQAVREQLAAGIRPGDAIVFLHGYNVSFADAALRAAQIGADLAIPGVMAFFSWPSRARLLRYPADEASIEASEAQITQFLVDFSERSGAGAVHIIAHSMGNRGLMRAVNRIAAAAAERTHKPFGQIILAAPDVDSDTFRSLAAAYAAVAARTTLYVSAADLAVRASRLFHGAARIGFTPPVALLDGIDTINVAGVDLTLLGHGYVGENRPVLHDMHALITTGAAPDERAMLRRQIGDGNRPYWEIAA